MKTLTSCTKRYSDIPFAHRQPAHEGHCALIHGHNWSFEFEFVAKEKDECGFVIDFGKLKPLKKWIDDKFDHALILNESDPQLTSFRQLLDPQSALKEQFARIVTLPDCSAEGLAEYLFEQSDIIVKELSQERVAVKRVTVFEDSKNSATCIAK